MYPIERELFTLKSYVRNLRYPKGSIVEGYLAQECLTFCSRYLSGVETKFNQLMRNDDDHENGRPLGRKGKQGFQVKKRKRVARIELDDQTRTQAHRYVLFNSEEVAPFLKCHKEVIMKQRHSRRLKDHEIDKIHSQTFNFWFEEKVNDLLKKGSAEITDQIKWLAHGPNNKLRDVFDMGVQHNDSSIGDNNKDMTWVRTDVSEDEDEANVMPEMEEEQVEDDELVPEN
ncbi:hypothetical protein SLE2022_170030 [Rubroshorea leprosula]